MAGLACEQLRLVRQTPDGAERVILDQICADFPAGSLSLIDGPIGSGKTTLLHVLCAILRPTAGVVLADGEPISRFAPAHRDRWRRRAGLAFQTPHFLDELRVIENVMLPLVPTTALSDAHGRAEAALAHFGIVHLASRRIAGLSGGERQRITLARAFVGQPDFLFADEPTAHQDAEGAQLVLQRLRETCTTGTTVVVVSHDARVREAGLADHVWRLSAGRLDACS